MAGFLAATEHEVVAEAEGERVLLQPVARDQPRAELG